MVRAICISYPNIRLWCLCGEKKFMVFSISMSRGNLTYGLLSPDIKVSLNTTLHIHHKHISLWEFVLRFNTLITALHLYSCIFTTNISHMFSQKIHCHISETCRNTLSDNLECCFSHFEHFFKLYMVSYFILTKSV